jgi:hypothetical protein
VSKTPPSEVLTANGMRANVYRLRLERSAGASPRPELFLRRRRLAEQTEIARKLFLDEQLIRVSELIGLTLKNKIHKWSKV